VRILAVDDEKPRLLRDIERLGLRPGVIVTILKRNNDGSIDIEHDRGKISLNRETAAILRAEAAPAERLTSKEVELPLGKLRPGESAVIKAYGGGRGSMGRCLSLGFTPGSAIKMMENYHRGPVLVKIHDTEVAVGRQLADKISVVRKEAAC
jgi:Fe2+ transport system protein FeoA